MGSTASKTLRSAIVVAAVFVLFVAANVVLLDAPMELRMRALRRSFLDMPMLIAVAIGWLAYVSWLLLDARRPTQPSRNRVAGIGLTIITTLLISAGIVVLYEGVLRLFFGNIYFYSLPWRYWFRLFEAALFAVALVRISLPLLPRFDRMPPHTV
jgi:hypothetical protein